MAPALPDVMVEFRNFIGPIHHALFDGNPVDLTWNMETKAWC